MLKAVWDMTITSKSFSLTASSDDFRGSFGDDSFFGSLSTISAEDKIDGAGGNDSLKVSINAQIWQN